MWTGLAIARENKHSKLTESKSQPTKTSQEVISKKLRYERDLNKELLSKFFWHHNDIRCRNEAEMKLKGCGIAKDGTFLVRCSTACAGDFVISFNYQGKIIHFQIKYHSLSGGYSLLNNDQQIIHNGLEKLIEFYSKECIFNNCKLKVSCPGGSLPPPLSMSSGPTNALHTAIKTRNRELAIEILNHSLCPHVDSRNDEGLTPLHLAAETGESEIVSCLIAKGATIDATDKNGYTALLFACLRNHAKVVHLLIVDGHANPQCRVYATGDVALHIAARRGHVETIKTLLKLDIPCFPRNFDKVTPFELASKSGFDECVKLLDNYEAPPAGTKSTDWFHANMTSRKEAADIMNKYLRQNGYFLVRKSSSDPGKRVLEVCFNRKLEHFVIEICMSAVFIEGGPLLPSLEHLVEYYSTYADGLPDTLAVAVAPNGGLVPMTKQLPVSGAEGGNIPKPVEPMILDKRRLTIGSELGFGEFGSVLKGKWKAPSGEMIDVAIKTLHEEHMKSNKDNFLSEAKIMVNLSHQYIVKLIGICQGPPLMLVQELLPLGSLLDYMLDYPEKVKIAIDIPLWSEQIAEGMKYLEKEKFVHRDLAARNILLTSKKIAKICDFGLSRAVGSSDYYRASTGGKWPVKWYAPESINYGTFSSASDVWSFGVTLWEMYSLGDQPYENMNGTQVIELLENKGRLKPPSRCPNFMANLMYRCWQYHENERPTFKAICDELHSFKSS